MYPSELYGMAKRYRAKHKCSIRALSKIIGVSREMTDKLLRFNRAPGYRRRLAIKSTPNDENTELFPNLIKARNAERLSKQQRDFWNGDMATRSKASSLIKENSSMLTIMSRIKIHHLAEAGIPQAKIASLVGCGERSVRRVLEEPIPSLNQTDSTFRSDCGVGAPSKTAEIANKLADLLLRRPTIPLYDALCHAREWGYQGSVATFRKALKKNRPKIVPACPVISINRKRDDINISEYEDDNVSESRTIDCDLNSRYAGLNWLREVYLSRFKTLNSDEIKSRFGVEKDAAAIIISNLMSDCARRRRSAFVILCHLENISSRHTAIIVGLARDTVRKIIGKYKQGCAIDEICRRKKTKVKMVDNEQIKLAVFSILHSPPKIHGFVRTTWRQEDIKTVLKRHGIIISNGVVGQIVKNAGFRYKQAKQVLTSNDPNYREKLEGITKILNQLERDEKFFSIDEYGPFAIKVKGGRSLTPQGEQKIYQQFQKSKGWLIMTAAIELSTNQVTHFYSKKKNTEEMIKLLDVILEQYKDQKTIYLSWDAASWHASKRLYDYVELLNSGKTIGKEPRPVVKLAPLPARAQFLNVIEAVFNGMSRAIIHNSDYQSVTECMDAIDRYFSERNAAFRENPKRAGNKIWGKEPILAKFDGANNCKDPRYCR